MVELNLVVGLTMKDLAITVLNSIAFPEGKSDPISLLQSIAQNEKFKTRKSIIANAEKCLSEFGKTSTDERYVTSILTQELGYTEDQVETLFSLLQDYISEIVL